MTAHGSGPGRSGWPRARSCSRARRSTRAAATSSRAGGGSCRGCPSRRSTRFDTEDGRKTLAELFDGRSQLLVYHFMFGPDYEAGCPGCSSIADGFNGFACTSPTGPT